MAAKEEAKALAQKEAGEKAKAKELAAKKKAEEKAKALVAKEEAKALAQKEAGEKAKAKELAAKKKVEEKAKALVAKEEAKALAQKEAGEKAKAKELAAKKKAEEKAKALAAKEKAKALPQKEAGEKAKTKELAAKKKAEEKAKALAAKEEAKALAQKEAAEKAKAKELASKKKAEEKAKALAAKEKAKALPQKEAGEKAKAKELASKKKAEEKAKALAAKEEAKALAQKEAGEKAKAKELASKKKAEEKAKALAAKEEAKALAQKEAAEKAKAKELASKKKVRKNTKEVKVISKKEIKKIEKGNSEKTTKVTEKLEGLELKGDKHFNNFRYAEALASYQKLYVKNQNDDRLKLKIAKTYFKLQNYRKAANWYSGVTNSSLVSKEDIYNYAQALSINGDKEKAEDIYKKYEKLYPEDERAKRSLISLENYGTYLEKSKFYEIKVMKKINSSASDFSPTLFENKLVFVSNRHNTRLEQVNKSDRNKNFLDLYSAQVDNNGEVIGNISLFYPAINESFHEGPLTFFADNNKMIFTRTDYEKGKINRSEKANISNLGLFYTERSSPNYWKVPVKLPFSNEAYSVGHPAISIDGKYLYFASDMPGGYGNSDLYVVEYDQLSNEWGEPKNLGPLVNSEGNELFPTIYNDEVLYFSSNGHGGLGGLDIFTISLDDLNNKNTNGKGILNLGSPLNSSSDDFGIAFYPDDVQGSKGFFSSNRLGGIGKDDIYYFNTTSGNTPYDVAIGKGLKKESTIDTVFVKNNQNDALIEILERISNRPINNNEEMFYVYFQSNKANLSTYAYLTLDKIVRYYNANKDKIEKIDLRGHTDAISDLDYNDKLSSERVESVGNYLRSRGLAEEFIKEEYFGETLPIAPNEDPIGRQTNRRVEIMITKITGEAKTTTTKDVDIKKGDE